LYHGEAPTNDAARLNSTVNGVSRQWLYDGVLNLEERAHGACQVGQRESPIAVGLRDRSMCTPGNSSRTFLAR